MEWKRGEKVVFQDILSIYMTQAHYNEKSSFLYISGHAKGW